jgi:predicted amidohydrolase YtcJ
MIEILANSTGRERKGRGKGEGREREGRGKGEGGQEGKATKNYKIQRNPRITVNLTMKNRYPTKADLDSCIPDVPVLVLRMCRHIGVLNSKVFYFC